MLTKKYNLKSHYEKVMSEVDFENLFFLPQTSNNNHCSKSLRLSETVVVTILFLHISVQKSKMIYELLKPFIKDTNR